MNYEERKAAKAAHVAILKAKYPTLSVGCDCVTAAKNIRAELKAAFPRTKFSVKTSKYSGGNSVHIRWVDGPTSSMVDAIVSKYAHGSFNGMDDSYSFNDAAWTDAFGGTYYVFTHRGYSDAATAGAIRTLRAKHSAHMADVEAKVEVTVEAYNAGKLWGAPAPWSPYGDNLARAIGVELSRRVWELPAAVLVKPVKGEAEEIA